MEKITTCLWFDGNAGEAMEFYLSVFKNSKAGHLSHYGETGPGKPGSVLTATFELEGRTFLALNGGPNYKFTPAISMVVNCDNQAEIDRYWEKLLEGGREDQCGWLTDKFGLSWQIVPNMLGKYMSGGDPEKSGRMMQALLQMKKLDIAKLEAAYNG